MSVVSRTAEKPFPNTTCRLFFPSDRPRPICFRFVQRLFRASFMLSVFSSCFFSFSVICFLNRCGTEMERFYGGLRVLTDCNIENNFLSIFVEAAMK